MSDDNTFRICTTQNTVAAVWSGEPTATRLVTLVQAMRDLHSVNPDGVYLYNVITQRTGMPGKAARDLMAKQFESMRGKLIAVSIVLEHSGIQYTLSRAVLGTLTTITRSPFQMKIFEKRDAAANWLSLMCKVPSTALVALASKLHAELVATNG